MSAQGAVAARAGRPGTLAAFGLGAVWLAGPAVAAYSVAADQWLPLLVLFPLMGVDHLLFRGWIEHRALEPDPAGVLTEADDRAISRLPDHADLWDHALFALEHPELVQRLRYAYRAALVIRSLGTVLTVAGFVVFVLAAPEHPAIGAAAALTVVAAGGSMPYQLTLLAAPRMRVAAGQAGRERWLRVDRIVEILGWTVLAVIVALQLFGGR